MDLNQVIFVDNLPSVDLHGLDKDAARLKVLELINDNIKMKNDIICIIHGVGSGILKREVHNTLKNCPKVLEYKIFYNNVGCTIAKLNI